MDSLTDNSLPPRLEQYFKALYVLSILYLVPLDFPFFHHHSHVPRYGEDDHDVCRAYGGQLVIGIFWFMLLMISLLRKLKTKPWAADLLLYPTLIFSLVGGLSTLTLIFSYTSHNEFFFAKALALFTGTAFGLVNFIQHALVTRSNSVNEIRGIFWTNIFFFLCGIVHALYESQYFIFLVLDCCAALAFRGFHKFVPKQNI